MEEDLAFSLEDDSAAAWVVNIIIAFIVIKYLLYPGLGLLMATPHPVVAVVSESMEHTALPVCVQDAQEGVAGLTAYSCAEYSEYVFEICGERLDYGGILSFDQYWQVCGDWYEDRGITQLEFSQFPFL